MADVLAAKLAKLGFKLPKGAARPSKALVEEFAERFDLDLPSDFAAFLAKHGGVRGMAVCPMVEPTPFGTDCAIDCFFGFEDDEIGDSTDLIDGAPDIIAIGGEPLGKMYWLFCTEPFAGRVYVRDHEGRSSWPDEKFKKWFPNLAPEIKTYLDLRRKGKLPQKPEGFEDVYLAAESITEFIEKLEPYQDNA